MVKVYLVFRVNEDCLNCPKEFIAVFPSKEKAENFIKQQNSELVKLGKYYIESIEVG